MISRPVFRIIFLVGAFASFGGAQSPQGDTDTYARYKLPAQCVYAVKRLENRYWRDRRPDTLYVSPLGRPSQPSSIEEARKCVSRFDVNKIGERDLLALGYAYLIAGDDSKANVPFLKLLALQDSKKLNDRAWVLTQIVNIHTRVYPVRIDKAREYTARLDSMGPLAAMERLVAHLNIFEVARTADSLPLMEEEAKAAVKASKEIAADSVKKERAPNSADAYLALAHVYMRQGEIQVSNSVLKKAIAYITPIRPASVRVLNSTLREYSMIGKPAPRLKATRWFNDANNGIHPAPGRVSTVTFVSPSCNGDLGDCYPGYSVLKRLNSQPNNQSLDAVLITRTEGYYRTALVEPLKEMNHVRQYFLDYLKLPGTLGIWQTDFGLKSDGRLEVLSNPNQDSYAPSINPQLRTYIIDKTGIVRFITRLSPEYEAEINNVIKILFRGGRD